MLAYGDHTAGCEISPAVDSDQFTLSGSMGDRVRIHVLSTTTNMDPFLEVRDPSGGLLGATSCNNRFCNISMDLVLPENGIYLLTLRDAGANEAGAYTLQVETLSPAPSAPRLDYDMEVTEAISPQTDADHYRFFADTGTSVRINAFSTTTNLDPTIEVRDPNGALLLNGVADGASCNNRFCSFSVDLDPPVTGFYSIFLYDAGTNESGNYELSLWCTVGPCDSDGDGNPDAPPPTLTYITPVSEGISPAVDGDLFRFNGKVGTSIRLNAFSVTANMDPTIEVRDPNGALIIDGVMDGASCNNRFCNFSIDFSPVETGTYTVLLRDAGTNECGDYQLSLWCLAGDCDSDADGFPDGDREILLYGDSKSRAISPAVDADTYVFRGTAGDQVRLTALSVDTNMDPTIEVRDPAGKVLIFGVADGASCNNRFCSFSKDFDPPVTGTYTVLLYDAGTNEAGSYQLGLECLFSPGDFVCDDIGALPLCDNCSEVANSGQDDADTDGFGNVCDADFDGNRTVDFADLAFMKSVFFTSSPVADLNADGRVDFGDLAILKSGFFGPPGPSCKAPNTP